MARPSKRRRFTEDEYLMLERASASRSEFLDGQIHAMLGGSRAHSLIAGNIAGLLRNALRGGHCETHQSDMRLAIPGAGLYTGVSGANERKYPGPGETSWSGGQYRDLVHVENPGAARALALRAR